MKSKYIVVPTAAFLMTAGTAFAFNGELLEKIELDLLAAKLEALETAHELRHEGNRQEARAVIQEASLTRAEMKRIHEAVRAHRLAVREQIKEALYADSYTAFREAISETRLSDLINSEEAYEEFARAHDLLKSGEREAAKEIFAELGLKTKEKKHHHKAR